MGDKVALAGGHLCIDLTNIEMTGDQQQGLLRAVQATVVAYLARHSAVSRVVTISMAPNNGQKEDQPDERQEPGRKPDPDDKPDPERTPPPQRAPQRERAN
jgi:hypothetical protein